MARFMVVSETQLRRGKGVHIVTHSLPRAVSRATELARQLHQRMYVKVCKDRRR